MQPWYACLVERGANHNGGVHCFYYYYYHYLLTSLKSSLRIEDHFSIKRLSTRSIELLGLVVHAAMWTAPANTFTTYATALESNWKDSTLGFACQEPPVSGRLARVQSKSLNCWSFAQATWSQMIKLFSWKLLTLKHLILNHLKATFSF